MKLTIILLTAAFLNVSAKGLSQNVTFSGENVPLEKVFSEVKKQTGFVFFYDADLLNKTTPVTIKTNNLELETFLNLLFKDQPLKFSIKNKAIFIFYKTSLVPGVDFKSAAFSPLSPIRGRVVDADGAPLAGATVTLKGGKVLGVTNAEGVFSVNVSVGDVLVISSVGFESTDYKITPAIVESSDQQSTHGTGVSLTITLKRKENQLDEVVVNKGYYTEKMRNTVGNISHVDAKTIEKQPISNPLQAIQGRMPGVFITQTTGMASGSFTIQIRGRNSIAGGTDPLYVIDGVPYVSSFSNTNISSPQIINPTGGHPLNFINPSDIESINVLKDADATAIYGSRGANGVILITTKKGKAGKMKLNVNAYSGIAKAPLRVKWLNTQQYLAMRKEAFANDNATPNVFNAPDLLSFDSTRYTDWQKLLIGNTARFHDAQVSLSGGTANVQYVIGGGYHRETTVFPSDQADQKASVHFNITSTSLNQKAQLVLTANYVQDNSTLPGFDATTYISTAPNAPEIYNADGSLNWANGGWENPFSFIKRDYKATNYNLVGNAIASYKIADGLEIKSSFGYSFLNMDENNSIPISTQYPGYSPKGFSVFGKNTLKSWIIEPQASYQRSIGKGKFDALIGITFQQNTSDGMQIAGTGYTSDALLGNLQAAPTIQVQSIVDAKYRYNAFWGRVNYNYDDKYLVNLTGRRDGSSRFGSQNRFKNFGAIGVAWIFSKEKLIQEKLSFLSFGKLRFSYGTTGSDQIGDYKFYDLYTTSNYAYQDVVGLNPSILFNPYLAWEETKKMEAGLEIGIMKDRINFSASYFRNKSGNQLVPYALPSTTGFNDISSNLPAVVENSGWEFLVNTVNIRSRNFTWGTSFNLTVHRNKLVSYPDLSTSIYANSYIVGQPLSISKMYDFAGVDPQTGRYQFRDKDGHLTFTPVFPADRTVIIDRAPKYYGGVQNTFSYKGLELEVFFQFVKQMGTDPIFQFPRPAGFGPYGGNRPIEVLDRWQRPGDNATYSRAASGFGSPVFGSFFNAAISNRGFTDASFVRLKNLSLNYNLPSSWIKSMRINALQVYIHGQNLWTITKYKGLDPETQNMASLPMLKVWTFGVKLSF